MRADLYLVEHGYAASRTLAQKLISEGVVTVDGRPLKKPSEDVPDGAHEVLVADTATTHYVGRGGLKLEAALAAFPVDVRGATVADIGASTGGFTDCLLQNGAARIFAVDSGHGQLHPRLASDVRVRSMEGVNARYLSPADLARTESERTGVDFDGRVGGCVMDVSFISQTLLHPTVASLLLPEGWFISLIKPQFELTGSALGKGGVVKSEKQRRAAVDRVLASAAACGLRLCGVIESPIEGGDGNHEYLAYFIKQE